VSPAEDEAIERIADALDRRVTAADYADEVDQASGGRYR
jgi:hypothetical protein